MKLKLFVEVDPDRCCGSGMCALIGGALFDQTSGDGTGLVRRREVPEDQRDLALECERICPSGAISVETEDPGG
jgi:ferredoxin